MERMAVVVERDMQIAVAIGHDADDIVRILHMALILGLLQNKFCVTELTFVWPRVATELLRNTVALTELLLYPMPASMKRGGSTLG